MVKEFFTAAFHQVWLAPRTQATRQSVESTVNISGACRCMRACGRDLICHCNLPHCCQIGPRFYVILFDKSLCPDNRIRRAVFIHFRAPIKTPTMVGGWWGGSDTSSLTKKSSCFSFRSPLNVNGGDWNQFCLRYSLKYGTSLFNFLFFRGTDFRWLCIPARGGDGGKPVDMHFNGRLHACRIENAGWPLRVSASSSPVLFHGSITDDAINHQTLTPSLCHIFLLSHSQTRHSVKTFKVTYIQPLSFPSHSRGKVVGGFWSDSSRRQ